MKNPQMSKLKKMGNFFARASYNQDLRETLLDYENHENREKFKCQNFSKIVPQTIVCQNIYIGRNWRIQEDPDGQRLIIQKNQNNEWKNVGIFS